MAASSIRYGRGATAEVGMDAADLGARRVALVTDPNVRQTPAFAAAHSSLRSAGVAVDVFDAVRVEPTDASMQEAVAFARRGDYDVYVAVGGGSVIDTAKVANLYATHKNSDFLDFVNAPIGRGLPVPGLLRPLIAVPTTAGTGSETTGVAIFDHGPTRAKTGIGSRLLRPTLGIVDPLNTRSMPRGVRVASGLDVLCHALESWTARPYGERLPKPARPALRPAYQGSNPISDVWSLQALRMISRSFERAVGGDEEAGEDMALASAYAGIGFGNAGVHLPHGMSYPISGLCKALPHIHWRPEGYPGDHDLIPHGVSVAVPAPAVFRLTGPTSPGRHREAAGILGADVSRCAEGDGDHAGRLLADEVLGLMGRLGVPAGLAAFGYTREDIPALVAGTLPQERVTKLAPLEVTGEVLGALFEDALEYT